MIDPDIIRYISQQQYNIMPYGGAFFLGCMIAMYTFVEVDQSFFGISWGKFFMLIAATLACMSVFPLTGY